MTRVRTLKAIKYAKTDDIQPILVLDGYGQINVIFVDNLDHCLDSLNIRKNKQLSVSDIINANLVFSLARQLNLDPGIYREADALILDYIQQHISANVVTDDIPVVMQELQMSWQRLHQHLLAKRYIPIAEHRSIDRFLTQPPFAGFGGYEIFVKDYLYALTRVCLERQGELPPLFCMLMDIVHRSLHGLNYTQNYFHEQDNILSCLKWSCEEQQPSTFIRERETRQREFDKIKGDWFARVIGTVLIDLDEFELDFPTQGGVALARLIDEGSCISEDADLTLQLAPFVRLFSEGNTSLDEFMRSSKFSASTPQDRVLFQDAIRYAIAHYAKLLAVRLKHHREVPVYFWAGKGLLQEEKLVAFLEEPNNRQKLQDFELMALSKYSEHKVVQALVQAEKKRREVATLTEGFSSMSLGPLGPLGPYMPGHAPVPGPLLFRHQGAFQIRSTYVRSEPQVMFPEAIPEEENILLLKEPSGICALM